MYIPETNEDLIQKCHENNFKGDFTIENNIVVWKVNKHITLKILLHNHNDEGYIEEWYTDDRGKTKNLTHWHPENYEIFDDLKTVNDSEAAVLKKISVGESVIFGSNEEISRLKSSIFVKYKRLY